METKDVRKHGLKHAASLSCVKRTRSTDQRKGLAPGGMRLLFCYLVTFSLFILVQSRSLLVFLVLLLGLGRTRAPALSSPRTCSFLYRDIRFRILSPFCLSLFSRESHSCTVHSRCYVARDSPCFSAHSKSLVHLLYKRSSSLHVQTH
jgi:hypothetical protein